MKLQMDPLSYIAIAILIALVIGIYLVVDRTGQRDQACRDRGGVPGPYNICFSKQAVIEVPP